MPTPSAISGFVLAGGQSRRMGQNKALLDCGGGTPMILRVALAVREAAGNVTLLGDPAVYAHLGIPVVEDFHKGCGPIGGLHAALSTMDSEWCLMVACDLPNVTGEFLRRLAAQAIENGSAVTAAAEADGLQPLCAIYHRSALPSVDRAIASGMFRMRSLANELKALGFSADPELLRNVNTPDQWQHTTFDKTRPGAI